MVLKYFSFLNLYKMGGRKLIPILLKATSPEGETRIFDSIREAARELGFSERGVGRAFHTKRSRIEDYELEWLEPKVKPKPKIEKPKSEFDKV